MPGHGHLNYIKIEFIQDFTFTIISIRMDMLNILLYCLQRLKFAHIGALQSYHQLTQYGYSDTTVSTVLHQKLYSRSRH